MNEMQGLHANFDLHVWIKKAPVLWLVLGRVMLLTVLTVLEMLIAVYLPWWFHLQGVIDAGTALGMTQILGVCLIGMSYTVPTCIWIFRAIDDDARAEDKKRRERDDLWSIRRAS